ncbi:MAG TPA: ABC transporter ATP-binding protein [Methylomirabilota bacterium]|jgi:branched-chain amino acid transport system ATP-binding protein|nr:ABC transporter ATP-binding protein [Methylomirabilota bacterium]
MLVIAEVHVTYGNIRAVQGVSLTVRAGEIVTLVGPNGAGKSTLLAAAMGLVRPRSGTITFDGERIDGRSTPWIVRRGMSLVPEGRETLRHMTVRENLRLGAYARRDRSAIDSDLEAVLARFAPLRPRLGQKAGTLSGGEQQMLVIGRALMARPRLLLLDEPSLGLAPLVVAATFETIRQLRADGVTILLVEQNARQALHIADRAYVLETGAVVLEGTDLLENARVRAAYLGA